MYPNWLRKISILSAIAIVGIGVSTQTGSRAESTPVVEDSVDLGPGLPLLRVQRPSVASEVSLVAPNFVSADDLKGDEIVALESWLYNDGKSLLSVLVTRDQGPDHPIHHLESEEVFESATGSWTVSDIGGGDGRYVTAVLVVGELVVQVTGNGAPMNDIQRMAQSIVIGSGK